MILQGLKKLTSMNGGKTLGINLPKEWLRYHNINKPEDVMFFADEIFVIVPNGSRTSIEEIKNIIKKDEKKEQLFINRDDKEEAEKKEE